VDCAVDGTALTIRAGDKELPCVAHSMPFYDVDKKRRTAKG
jgi:aminomethyltransferase